MKKFLLVLVAMLSLSGVVFAQEGVIEPYVDAGDIIAMAGVGYGGIAAGFEYDFFRFNAGPLPLTFGAAARVAFDPLFQAYGTSFTVGGFAMAHLGFKGLASTSPSMEQLQRLDYYVGLGIGYATNFFDEPYYSIEGGIGFSWLTGVSYYFNDNLALYVEYGYIGRYTVIWESLYTYRYTYSPYYATVGVSLKL